ncbi:MAG: PKD domain-containing protein [Flavobacteriales bacterium]|nr:PKD domain-containing protein [Flavobacteriales bacterium]MCX7768901.1 PKD domain-containing protein [Flavobacteriales bacterium]MDW8410027.1 PKD domain-containing protein [Flavobacteriales bacterium]
MKRHTFLLIGLGIFMFYGRLSKIYSQTIGQNKSLLLSATVQNNPPAIIIHWAPGSGAADFKVYRKNKTATGWGSVLATLPGTATSWTDNNVSVGDAYEYRVVKSGGTTAYGYIYAGIEVPEVLSRGRILLVYDTISTNGLQNEIQRWIEDAEADGWDVVSIPVAETHTPAQVKNLIKNAYQQSPGQTQALFLLGRVPIPYSGNLAPDGHTPDHQGAWPADGYYGDMDGTWTDNTVNSTGASDARQHNVPGDGKWDQNTFPSNLELQVGRVDFRNITAFGLSETQLLKRYLDKNHAYRTGLITSVNRALIDDHFTSYSEGFSASAWRSFSPLVGPSQVFAADYFSELTTASYRWSYGCGAGSFTTCSGVGTANQFAADSLRTIFTMLFGSYFGDWDNPQNNLMRTALASGSTLAVCWAGRPFWPFHHMALGETLGFSARVSMNNSSTYDAGLATRGVHMALLGDPTLRADVVAPPSQFTATSVGSQALLTWSPSPDTSIMGYHIYLKNDSLPQWKKITPFPVTDTTYVDSCLVFPGIHTYMVKAVKLEITPSGTYYNTSVGLKDTLFSTSYQPLAAAFSYQVSGLSVQFNSQSVGQPENYWWDFGDGYTSTQPQPTHTYIAPGTYNVVFAISTDCRADTTTLQITLQGTDLSSGTSPASLQVFPNPLMEGPLYIKLPGAPVFKAYLRDVSGRAAAILSSQAEPSGYRLDLPSLHSGIYILTVETPTASYSTPIVVCSRP